MVKRWEFFFAVSLNGITTPFNAETCHARLFKILNVRVYSGAPSIRSRVEQKHNFAIFTGDRINKGIFTRKCVAVLPAGLNKVAEITMEFHCLFISSKTSELVALQIMLANGVRHCYSTFTISYSNTQNYFRKFL